MELALHCSGWLAYCISFVFIYLGLLSSTLREGKAYGVELFAAYGRQTPLYTGEGRSIPYQKQLLYKDELTCRPSSKRALSK